LAAVPAVATYVFAVVVSLTEIRTAFAIAAVAKAGLVFSKIRTVIVSVSVVDNPDTVNEPAVVVSFITEPEVALAATELIKVAAPAVGVEIATSEIVADDGATESIPKPNAAITPSATRLKFVFVDIDFLSIVVSKTFSLTAGKELIFAL
jgi:hypothetical protein